MADDVVIRAEGLGKRYIIGHEVERERYVALRDVLARAARGAWRRTVDLAHGRAVVSSDRTEEFWALRDVSFEVRRGEVLGIIGRNGAGKSTLLKILSRITEPSEGRITIKGRVASLLEVGTGFHPELTGRENIYLNGAILGMMRAEIRRKFDEIVAFAEVERFLDTPVKHYSSGMYVRLAFAVAAHLEPEILVVDEVLAVGDADFQKKCLGKMSEVAGCGRTVLFVSHNMGAISSLCTKGLVLINGHVEMSSAISAAIEVYTAKANSTTVCFPQPKYSEKPKITAVTLIQPSRCVCDEAESTVLLEISILANVKIAAGIDVRLKNMHSTPVGYGSLSAFNATRPLSLKAGTNRVVVEISTGRLAAGDYFLSVDLTDPFIEFFDRVEDCVRLEISSRPQAGMTRKLEQSWGHGCVVIPLQLKHCSGSSFENPEDAIRTGSEFAVTA